MTNANAIAIENNSGMSYSTLIPVRLGELAGEVVQLCNAKDVFICLGVRSRFNDWIARRIEEYGFIEGQDFYSEKSKKAQGQRGRASVDYSLSVDMAKELAMVERTEAGRRIRRYFIDCEKRLRQIAPESAAEALRKALSPEQQHTLSGKVHSKVACLEKARQRAGYCELWSSLKAKHQVARYQDISQGEFDEACSFVDSYAWEGEWIGKEEQGGIRLSRHETQCLYLLMNRFFNMNEEKQRLHEAAVALDSKPLLSVFSQLHEACFSFRYLDKRRDEIYREYLASGSQGGYAMRAAA